MLAWQGTMGMRRWFVPLWVLALSGCSNESPPTNDANDAGPDGAWGARYSTDCGPNLRPYGPACVPVLDDCEGGPGYRVPVPGGGCKRVGVELCADGTGLRGPPDWTCKQVGPPAVCLPGWWQTGGGWCEPVLPAEPCGAGAAERIGYTTCQPVGECGPGTWGAIKTGPNTLFVDQTYTGNGADGSADKPFATIGQALAVAVSDGQIAVAAGQYDENLTVDKKVAIDGRCPKLVRIVGQDPLAPAVSLLADDAQLSGVTVTGPSIGIAAQGVRAKVTQVVVEKCGGQGIAAAADAELTLETVLADGNDVGLAVFGSTVTLERSVLRGSSNVGLLSNSLGESGSAVTLKDSVVATNTGGISGVSTILTLERVVVRDNLGSGVPGIVVATGARPATLSVKDCLVAGNQPGGIFLRGDGTIVRSVVRDSQPPPGMAGYGIWVHRGSLVNEPTLTVQDCVVTGNQTNGIHAGFGYRALVERTRVLDTEGCAICATYSTLKVHQCVIDGIRGVGINAAGAEVVVEHSHVSKGQTGGITAGMALADGTLGSSSLSVSDSAVTDCDLFGISASGSTLSVERTVVRATGTVPLIAGGGGISSIASPFAPTETHRLDVRDSLLEQNSLVGLLLNAANGVVERTVVRDSQPGFEGKAGYGIALGPVLYTTQEGPVLSETPSRLELRDSLVERNHAVGLGAWGAEALDVERSIVRDTLTGAADSGLGFGVAVTSIGKGSDFSTVVGVTVATGMYSRDLLTRATIEDSRVSGSRTAGILMGSGTMTVRRAVVQDTEPDAGKWGDGIQVSALPQGVADWLSWPQGHNAVLHLSESVVERSDRAGVLFSDPHATGSVRRSVLRANLLPLDLEKSAGPELAEDNLYIDNMDDNIGFGQGLAPAPLPLPPGL